MSPKDALTLVGNRTALLARVAYDAVTWTGKRPADCVPSATRGEAVRAGLTVSGATRSRGGDVLGVGRLVSRSDRWDRGGLPAVGQQVDELLMGRVGQSAQHVDEIRERLDVVHLARSDEAEVDRGCLAAAIAANHAPILAIMPSLA